MAKGKYERRRKHRSVYIWMLALILTGASVWGVSAKYMQQREQEMLVQAEMFYFTSDLLTEEGAVYTINPDTTSISFTLNNFIDSFRVSEDEIQYEVYVNNEQLGGTAVLNESKHTAKITFDVEAGQTYGVRAVGNAGYTKTLSATFEVAEKPTGFFKHLDNSNSNYVLLTVWTEQISGEVTVSFPDGLIPDTTNSELENIKNYDNGSYIAGSITGIRLEEYHSRTYRFFKEDPSRAYSVDDFTVTMGARVAQTGTP